MWPSLKQTLPVMPGRADAKIHLTQDKVFYGWAHTRPGAMSSAMR